MPKPKNNALSHIPHIVASKQAVNQECLESLGGYADNAREVLAWVTKHKTKIMKRIASAIDEAENNPDISLSYQVALLTKITDLLFKLEAVKGAYLDRITALDIPAAPDIPTTARIVNPEFKRLAEMMLTVREKHGLTSEDLISATIEMIESGDFIKKDHE